MKNSKLQQELKIRLCRKPLLILCLFIVFTNTCFSQWIQQSLPTKQGIMLCAEFRNQKNGVTCGWKIIDEINGSSFYTIDGGKNWISSSLPDSVRAILDIHYFSDNEIIAVGAYNILQKNNKLNNKLNFKKENFGSQRISGNLGITNNPNYGAIILKSTDGGFSWFTFNKIPSFYNYLYKIKFMDSQNGYLTGVRQLNIDMISGISKTTNGGNTWTNIDIPVDTSELFNIEISGNNLFAAGYEKDRLQTDLKSGVILKSNDNGHSWKKSVFTEESYFTDIKFINNNTGYASANYQVPEIYNRASIYKTTNAGANWYKINLNLDSTLIHGLGVNVNSGTVIIFGNRVLDFGLFGKISHPIIGRSNDYGSNWSFQTIQFSEETELLHNSFFFDSRNILLTGGTLRNEYPNAYIDPLLIKTTNDGLTFQGNNTSVKPNGYYLFQNYPNPFNPSTNLEFGISHLQFVSLKVYDVLGNEVATLVNEKKNPGNYKVVFSATDGGSNLPSGVYFYKLETSEFSEVKKMILVK